MIQERKKNRPKIVVIGGGTGLPVILNGLKSKQADVTAIVTVADDGGSSGTLRNYANIVPPGDIRNVLISLSNIPMSQKDIFQYRFDTHDHFLAGHSIGNLIIAAMSEMRGSIFEAIQLLSKMMMVDGHVYPAAEEALILHAIFEDGSRISGESKIAKERKKIERVYVTTTEEDHEAKASRKVIAAIHDADMVVLGPGSLFTSILPNLMINDLGKAVTETEAKVVYICNIMTQLGETENFTDADHVCVLHQHLNKKFIDTVLVNIGEVPENYMDTERYNEYLVQVTHNFKKLAEEVPSIISDDFLELRNQGVFHNGEKVVDELFKMAFDNRRVERKNS
ncbi:gluconeogenesis factor YvcK family protein [Carnobacterium pleistocenium]|uniref:gluconeogenesis factor YvcK family protein n=1 Tax=Carnobacterium pleistocenium TaxID=181073 RepID=UPI0005587767|nr:YvcK family protein [Carnobacterium pleistocenium]